MPEACLEAGAGGQWPTVRLTPGCRQDTEAPRAKPLLEVTRGLGQGRGETSLGCPQPPGAGGREGWTRVDAGHAVPVRVRGGRTCGPAPPGLSPCLRCEDGPGSKTTLALGPGTSGNGPCSALGRGATRGPTDRPVCWKRLTEGPVGSTADRTLRRSLQSGRAEQDAGPGRCHCGEGRPPLVPAQARGGLDAREPASCRPPPGSHDPHRKGPSVAKPPLA